MRDAIQEVGADVVLPEDAGTDRESIDPIQQRAQREAKDDGMRGRAE